MKTRTGTAALAAAVVLLAIVAVVYAQEQQRLYNILVLTRMELGAAVTAIFEGATNDGFETTLTVTDPTADRTITLLNATGTVMIADADSSGKVVAGSVQLDGSNPTSVTTGLSAITGCTSNYREAAALADDPVTLTTEWTAVEGRLDIYALKNTSGTDPTQIASTATHIKVAYVCVGTP